MVRAFSYGGGVQSTAALVLAARGEIDYPLFVFANTGDDSEHPATLRYVREIAMPFAAEHGIELIERERGGVNTSLLNKIERLPSSVPIPMRMERSGAPGNRTCTSDFKIDVIYRELKARGATEATPATVGLGISLDEYQRMRPPTDPRTPYQRREYPLIDMRLDRQDCINIVQALLPVPPRSACWFCPFHSLEEWRRLKRDTPDLFEASCQLEERMQARRRALGKDNVWMTDAGARDHISLRDLLGDHDQLVMEEATCESGYCMT